jgi:multiple sugar transport system substrate-binding protein
VSPNLPAKNRSEAIRSYVEILEQVINIPGNVPDYLDDPVDHFFNDGRFIEGQVAMMTLYNHRSTLELTDEELGFEYDIAVHPQFPDLPGVQPETKGNTIGVAKTSENKDAAFEVIEYILSEEFQIREASERSRMSSLAGNELNEQYYGKEFPHLEDKNMDALYALTPATGPESRSRYDEMSTMARETVEGLLEGKDVNTVLREWRK